jgi:hypothetical protein
MFFFEHPRLFFSVQPVAAWLALAPRSTAGAWYVGSGTTYDRLVSLRPALSTKASTQRTEGGSASPPLMWINVGTLVLGGLADGSSSQGRFDMSAIIKSEMISRRKALSLVGLAAAFGLAAAPTVLTVSDAEAQTAGMERRQERRAGRHERREERRAGRHERREERRAGRTERREERRTGTTTGTGTATTTGTAK